MMALQKFKNRDCPDCGVEPGAIHNKGCDVEQCARCGGQRLGCGCRKLRSTKSRWTGIWPGVEECHQYGFFALLGHEGEGWIPCGPNEPGAQPDINRLVTEGRWDRENQRFVVD
jgi:hypothetical protein